MGKDAEYRRVRFRPFREREGSPCLRDRADGGPVYHVLTPFETGQRANADRGSRHRARRSARSLHAAREPADGRAAHRRRLAHARADRARLRLRPHRPPTSSIRSIWAGIALGRGRESPRPWWWRPTHAHPGGWPKGGRRGSRSANEHLQYAINLVRAGRRAAGHLCAYHVSRDRLKGTDAMTLPLDDYRETPAHQPDHGGHRHRSCGG